MSSRELLMGCAAVGLVMVGLFAIIAGIVFWSQAHNRTNRTAPKKSSGPGGRFVGRWTLGYSTREMTVDDNLHVQLSDSRLADTSSVAIGVLAIDGNAVRIHAAGPKVSLDKQYRFIAGTEADMLAPVGSKDPKLSETWFFEGR